MKKRCTKETNLPFMAGALVTAFDSSWAACRVYKGVNHYWPHSYYMYVVPHAMKIKADG